MSNFIKRTKHPITGEWFNAEWLDDHFGPRIYGVRFPTPKGSETFMEDAYTWETEEATESFESMVNKSIIQRAMRDLPDRIKGIAVAGVSTVRNETDKISIQDLRLVIEELLQEAKG